MRKLILLNNNHTKSSLTKIVTRVALIIGAITIIVSSLPWLAVTHVESQSTLQNRIDTIVRIEAPLIIQILENNNLEVLDTHLNNLVNTEKLTHIKLLTASGKGSTQYQASTKQESHFFWGTKATSKYIKAYPSGTIELQIQVREAFFSPKILNKLAIYFFLKIATISLLLLMLLYFLKNFIFSRLSQVTKHLDTIKKMDTISTEKFSDPISLNSDKKIILEDNELDTVFNFIEALYNDYIQCLKQKRTIELVLLEEKQQKLETRRLINEAKAANKAKSEFIATMSHEIRTPLNGVVGMVEMLRDTPLNNNQKHYLDVLYRSGDSLLEIINDILDYSKIESGRMLLEKINFDLEKLIENCCKLFSPVANKRNIELVSNIAPDTPTLLIGDPTRLRQVIVNLVGNAFKFTKQGFVSLNICTQNDAKNGVVTLLFSISDSGIGISKKEQDHLFEAFQQADSSTTRKFGGSGLGLAICKQLAELMDGEIGIESEQGTGSTFWFTSRFAIDSKATQDNPLSCSLALSEKKLLTVNLSKIMLHGLRQHAPTWNLTFDNIDDLPNSPDNLTKGNRAIYDFVLIDHRPKYLDGFNIAKRIQTINAYYSTPIMVITSQQASSFSQSQLYSVSSIIPRPIAIQNFKNTLISQGYGTQLNPLMSQASAKPNHSALNVLVAEDNAVNRMVIEGLLGKFEIKPDFAENGSEAVKFFLTNNKHYDLILMDCEMPEMDGFSATMKIREEEKNQAKAATPIIALTAHVEASHRQRVFECGMNHFLSKPVTLDKLSEALASVGLNNK